jgi:hypothetical protein
MRPTGLRSAEVLHAEAYPIAELALGRGGQKRQTLFSKH